MPQLKSYRRIITTDFDPEFKPLVENMGSNINDGFADLFFAVGGRLDLKTNIFCTVKDVDVTVDASGNPVGRTVFTTKNPGVPVLGISVIAATNQTNTASYPTSHPFISFTQVDSGVLINNITGLQPNVRYTIRLIAWN
jgi:hypothetical protein